MTYVSKKTLRISKIIFVIILLQMIVVVTNSQKSASGSLPVVFYPGESFTWEIDDINDGTNMWWNSTDWSLTAIWHAEVGDEVSFDVTDSLEKDSKNYLVGNLNIGNLSITNNDYDNGFNLALSANPWYGGLISLEQDWSALANQDPFNGENASIQLNCQANILGLDVNTVRITFNDAFQESELFYESTTGILISANTTVGLYSMQMHLTSTSIPLPTVTGILPLPGIFCFLFSVTFLTLFTKAKKKRS
ncbi:MAG: hypothetical protein ACTSPM_07280 [Candidatus Heimdallarchaeota archaeon]